MRPPSDNSKDTKNITGLKKASNEEFQKYLITFGRKIQERRISLKKEIKALASDLHITSARLERIEAGNDSNLRIGLFHSLCIELELDPHEVIGWKDIT